MDNFFFSVDIVLPLFVIMAIGYSLSRLRVFTPEFLVVCNKFCFTVLLPLLLFINISESDFETAFQPKLIAYGVSTVIVLFLVLCLIVPRGVKNPLQRGVVIQAIFRTNCLLFGTTLCINIYGSEGGAVASVLIAFIVPLFNALAVVALAFYTAGDKKVEWKQTLLKVITNPLILGAAAGMVFVAFGWKLPQVVRQPLNDIARMATPMATLVLGGDFQFRRVAGKLRIIMLTTLCRLVAVPAVALVLAALLGFRGPAFAALLAVFGSPISVSSYVMAKNAEADSELAGQLIVFTTCFSLITVFALVYYSRVLGLI